MALRQSSLLNIQKEAECQKHLEEFAKALNKNILKNNPQVDTQQILKTSQKIISKILFNLFAQKRELVLSDFYESFSHTLIIEEELINSWMKVLLKYDFVNDISLNIMGTFFEGSMSGFDAKETKRKREGIFYTPKYITAQMVENSLEKMYKAKRKELGVEQKKNLLMYKKWLLGLKILDPSCGSGAFLNQALVSLIQEHKKVQDELLLMDNNYAKESLDKSLLLQNLYGVDINEEAVAIASVSLWLATAKKGQSASELASNIKVGNALIEDAHVVANAFVWEQEFPEVFAQGGFDLIIGNPPYIAAREWENEATKHYLTSKYKLAQFQFDIYVLFFELALRLVAHDGIVSFITPNAWLNNVSNQKLREMILAQTSIVNFVDYSKIQVFERVKVFTVITTLQKSPQQKSTQIYASADGKLALMYKINQNIWLANDHSVININLSQEDRHLLKKIESNAIRLDAIAKIKFGVKLYEKGTAKPKQESSFSKEHIYESRVQVDESYKKYLRGKDIENYGFCWENRWIKYGNNLAAPRDAELFKNRRIVVRRVVGERLIATSLHEDYITSQLLQIVKLENDKLTNVVTAILNSVLMIYFFRKKYNRQNKRFPEIRIYELASLPIAAEIYEDVKIEARVEKLIALKKNLQENCFKNDAKKADKLQKQIKAVENEIDKMVYKLYALSDEEILVIEGKK